MSFNNLHDRSVSKIKNIVRQTRTNYYHKRIIEQQQLYDSSVFRDEKKFHLGKFFIIK